MSFAILSATKHNRVSVFESQNGPFTTQGLKMAVMIVVDICFAFALVSITAKRKIQKEPQTLLREKGIVRVKLTTYP